MGSDTHGFVYEYTVRNKMLTIKAKGRACDIPNLWPHARLNDPVGFIVKEVSGRYDRFYDIDGNAKDELTRGSFLQLIPWSPPLSSGMKFPPYCSSLDGQPFAETDRDYFAYVPPLPSPSAV